MSLKSAWCFFKRHPKKLIFLSILFYFSMFVITTIYTPLRIDDKDCKETTEALGGGTHRYDGQDYTFTLCGSLIVNRFGSSDKPIRLQIRDAQNELLVERVFVVDAYGWGRDALSHEKSSVIYFDDSKDGDYANTILMPPSRWEWLKVRISHAFWGAMEFVFVNPLKLVFSSKS